MTEAHLALVAVLTADAEALAALLSRVSDKPMRQHLRRLLAQTWAISAAIAAPADEADGNEAERRATRPAETDDVETWQTLSALQLALERCRRELEPRWRPALPRRRWPRTRSIGVVAARAGRLQQQVAAHTGARLALSAARLAWWEARWSQEVPGLVATVRPAAAQPERLDLPLLRKRGAGDAG